MKEGNKMKDNINEELLKNVLGTLSNNTDFSYLGLYRNGFKDTKSIMELFFDHYFEKIEGASCSHDKSSYTVRKINKYLFTGEDSLLKQTYGEYASKGGDIGSLKEEELDEIAYWCPRTIEKLVMLLNCYLTICQLIVIIFKNQLKINQYRHKNLMMHGLKEKFMFVVNVMKKWLKKIIIVDIVGKS